MIRAKAAATFVWTEPAVPSAGAAVERVPGMHHDPVGTVRAGVRRVHPKSNDVLGTASRKYLN
jgi:hypothetical protein